LTTEIKLIVVGILVIVLALGGFLLYRSAYDSGQTAGKAEVQTLWDTDKAKIQAVTDAAIAQVTKDKEAAIAANEAITNDLQKQLGSMRDLNTGLAQRLRLATSASANSGTVPKASDNPKSPTAPIDNGVGRLNDAFAATLTECRTNWANYSALIKELKPQLVP
jgi:hypothetical protein